MHYTAQPLLLLDPGSVDVGSSDLPVLFELGEGSYFSEGDDYSDDPTISLLTGSEPPTSSKRAHATRCVSQVCCRQSPSSCGRPLLTLASAGDIQTLQRLVWLSLCILVCPRLCLSPLSISGGYRV